MPWLWFVLFYLPLGQIERKMLLKTNYYEKMNEIEWNKELIIKLIITFVINNNTNSNRFPHLIA